MAPIPDLVILEKGVSLSKREYGSRAECLSKLINADFPVPAAAAISIPAVRRLAAGNSPDIKSLIEMFGDRSLFSVRSSPEKPEWGGALSFLNVGASKTGLEDLGRRLGKEEANGLVAKFVEFYSVHVAKLDPEEIENLRAVSKSSHDFLCGIMDYYRREMDEPFPDSATVQLERVLRSMARSWEGPAARMLRKARGASENAGIGLIVQEMAFGTANDRSGTGTISGVDPKRGDLGLYGTFAGRNGTTYCFDGGSKPFEADFGAAVDEIAHYLAKLRGLFGDVMEIDFVIESGNVWIIDSRLAPRSLLAEIRIAVDLVEDQILEKPDALTRIEPDSLARLMHPQVRTGSNHRVIARGVAASPGAVAGAITFSSGAALLYAARNEPCILVRAETGPEDVRGMYTAKGVLTGRGGITSHAAVIARGLGVPCVTGAIDVQFNSKAQSITTRHGKVFREGDIITINGTAGEVLEGVVPLDEPVLGAAFDTYLEWADLYRDIGVRVNADTLEEARVATNFRADTELVCAEPSTCFTGKRG